MPGDFFFPRRFSFSPDDRYIVADAGLQIALVDVAAGAYGLLFYADGLVSDPDWSPDGRSILYSRFFDMDRSGDSTGVRLFNLASRTDRRITVSGTKEFAMAPLWRSDGESFVAYEPGVPYRLVITRIDGTSRQVVLESDGMDYLRRYNRPSLGVRGFAFTAEHRGQLFVSEDGSNLQPFPWTYLALQAWISHDGQRMLSLDSDPIDSLSVLFIGATDDATGSSRRQLTFWDPPATGPYVRPSVVPSPTSAQYPSPYISRSP